MRDKKGRKCIYKSAPCQLPIDLNKEFRGYPASSGFSFNHSKNLVNDFMAIPLVLVSSHLKNDSSVIMSCSAKL